jgi:hypothetical protein
MQPQEKEVQVQVCRMVEKVVSRKVYRPAASACSTGCGSSCGGCASSCGGCASSCGGCCN